MSDAPTSPAPGGAIAGVAFSREELYVILRLLKAQALPGFDTTWAQTGANASGQPAAELVAVAQAGANALIARGYVTITPAAPGGEPVAGVAAPALALVGASAFSAYTLRIAGLAGGEYREFYLSQLGALGALHWTPSLNIHVFMPLAGRAGVLKAAVSLVGMDGAAVASGAQLGAIPLDALRVALEAARVGNAGGVQGALSQTMMSAPGAREGIEHALLRDPVFTQVTVGARNATGATTERSVFTLGSSASSSASSFLLSPAPENPALLAMYAGDARRFTEWLVAQLPSSAD